MLDSCSLENYLSIHLVSSTPQVWLGSAADFTMRQTGEHGNKAQPQLDQLLGQPKSYKPFRYGLKNQA